ncbi:hypothetical protein JOE36_004510 [Paenibacillus sp. PvP091]|nr:hypothetical protein [Paenibacillus sp. PvP091]
MKPWMNKPEALLALAEFHCCRESLGVNEKALLRLVRRSGLSSCCGLHAFDDFIDQTICHCFFR